MTDKKKYENESYDTITVNKEKKPKKAHKNITNEPKKPLAWRKFVILGSLVLLLIGTVIASFITEFIKNKVKPFDGAKIVSEKKLDLDFDFYCSVYKEPDADNKTQTLEFKATASYPSDADSSYTFSAVKCTAAIGNRNWTKRYKAGSSTTLYSTLKSSTTTTEKTVKITDYSYSYPTRKLGIIKISKPTVWVKLEYTKNTTSGKSETKSYVLSYSWNEYFKSGTTILN